MQSDCYFSCTDGKQRKPVSTEESATCPDHAHYLRWTEMHCFKSFLQHTALDNISRTSPAAGTLRNPSIHSRTALIGIRTSWKVDANSSYWKIQKKGMNVPLLTLLRAVGGFPDIVDNDSRRKKRIQRRLKKGAKNSEGPKWPNMQSENGLDRLWSGDDAITFWKRRSVMTVMKWSLSGYMTLKLNFLAFLQNIRGTRLGYRPCWRLRPIYGLLSAQNGRTQFCTGNDSIIFCKKCSLYWFQW